MDKRKLIRAARRGKTWVKTTALKGLILAGRGADRARRVFGAATPPPDFSYARDFTRIGPAAMETPYLKAREVEDEDEAEVFDRLAKLFVSDQTAPGAGKADPDHQDPHWGHTTVLLKGDLTIDDLGWLPDDLRLGLFAQERAYDVVARSNLLYDDQPLIAINRLSLKLNYPEPVPNQYAKSGCANELDLLFSEGQPPGAGADGQGFFFRDARQLLMANEMAPGRRDAKAFALDPHHGRVLAAWMAGFKASVDRLYESPQTTLAWAGKHYFSAGPYALGEALMKYALFPRTAHMLAREAVPHAENPAKLHKDWSAAAQYPVVFDLHLQIAAEAAIRDPAPGEPPKDVMATEFCDLVWDTGAAPFRRVGTLTLEHDPANPLDPALRRYATPMNAWNTLDCMRPVGQLFRARKSVHRAHRAARLKVSFDEADGVANWRCPFSGDPRS